MNDELGPGAVGDLGGPRGLEPGEKVPNQLRILAMQENLGHLHSVHRPATRLGRLAFKQARIYLYDKGFVFANGRGGTNLFRWEQAAVTSRGGNWLVTRADGPKFQVTKHWTDHQALGAAIEQGVARASGQAGA
ncbi:hypothetical protein KDL01_23095 [Actinospica durhamensis]|uniref:Uncharacterized protein n=1 Tax=Actinospica durhamensis TaxID=1508375 RepID=A0A941ES56_9ACTN|nr:hypothetical protein [Actinospica durhamensis]MBR7836183.1 hypothetical protein [Actinospica durhamensis]